MVTRRCSQRQLLLRPDTITNEAFLYCLGVAAKRYSIVLHWVLAMSNHHHTGIWNKCNVTKVEFCFISEFKG